MSANPSIMGRLTAMHPWIPIAGAASAALLVQVALSALMHKWKPAPATQEFSVIYDKASEAGSDDARAKLELPSFNAQTPPSAAPTVPVAPAQTDTQALGALSLGSGNSGGASPSISAGPSGSTPEPVIQVPSTTPQSPVPKRQTVMDHLWSAFEERNRENRKYVEGNGGHYIPPIPILPDRSQPSRDRVTGRTSTAPRTVQQVQPARSIPSSSPAPHPSPLPPLQRPAPQFVLPFHIFPFVHFNGSAGGHFNSFHGGGGRR